MRYLTAKLLSHLGKEGTLAFIAGPRRAGKATLVRHLLQRAGQPNNHFDWAVEGQRRAVLRKPSEFWSPTPGARIALEEIHRYPRWPRFLKDLHAAAGARTQILVTASASIEAGRVQGDALFRLHPFTLGEMLAPDRGDVRSPDEFWRRAMQAAPPPGAEEALSRLESRTGFPEPLFSTTDGRLKRWRRARNRQVFREDLRDLTRIRDIGLVEAMASLLPERVGTPLSLNALGRELGVSFGSVRGWLEALGSLYHLVELRPFAGRLSRTLRREGKVYLFDFSEVEDPAARFENLVALHLLKLKDAWNDLGLGDFELHYVRDKEKREVDFLLTKSGRPLLLLDTGLSSRGPTRPLLYFQQRLKPLYTVQLSREEPVGARAGAPGVLRLGAASFLSLI